MLWVRRAAYPNLDGTGRSVRVSETDADTSFIKAACAFCLSDKTCYAFKLLLRRFIARAACNSNKDRQDACSDSNHVAIIHHFGVVAIRSSNVRNGSCAACPDSAVTGGVRTCGFRALLAKAALTR